MASNSPFSSNSAVSSLLKSAQSTAAKAKSLQDAQIAFEWAQSPKTAEDFAAYSKYLNDRITGADASETLSLQKTLSSAQSGYISNEIQRQSQSVMEGSQDNVTKYNNVAKLYYQALNSGNYDSALSIRGTLDSLSVTIQNEEKARQSAAQSLAGKLSGQSNTDLKNQVSDAVDQYKGYIKDLGSAYSSLGEADFTKQYGKYAKDLGLPKDAGFFDIVTSLAEHTLGVYKDALQVAQDPSTIRQFQQEYDKLTSSDAFTLPGQNGKNINVSFDDLQKQIMVARTGQTLFRPVQTGSGTVFERNKDTGYAYGRDAQGNYRLIPLENPEFNYSTSAKDKKGNEVKAKTILENAGFQTTGGQGGGALSILYDPSTIRDPQLRRLFQSSGLTPGTFADVYVDANGNLQLSNGKQSFNLAYDDSGKAYGLYEQSPNPITLVPDAASGIRGDRFSNDFISSLNLDSLNAGTIGVIDNNPLSPAYRANQPGTVLGAALSAEVQLQKSAAVARLAANTGVPQAPATNLQPTLNPAALPRNTQITVPKSTPAPAPIKVVAPPPLPNLKVNTAPNTQNIKLNTKPNTQTIRL